MLADFVIVVHEARKPLAVQVKVHENVATLRSAATQYCNRWPVRKKKTYGEFSDTLGVCHRRHMFNDPLCAVVRLAPPNVGAGIVSHELCHAAIHMWEIHNEFKDVPITCENDEWFCWVLGELVRQTTIQLIDKKIY